MTKRRKEPQSRAEKMLLKWANFDPRRTHFPGWSNQSPTDRAINEPGKVTGVKGDGAMYSNYRHRSPQIDYLAKVSRMNAIVFRMRHREPDCFEVVRVAFVEGPPNRVKPYRMAAEELGWSEHEYRRIYDRLLGYVEGALDGGSMAA